MEKKYADCELYAFRASLNYEFDNIEVDVYVKPFSLDVKESNFEPPFFDVLEEKEEFVKKRYFTQERINELKQQLIKKIQECENPFNISCIDRDEYRVREELIFKLEK